jgi:hypothetical protein
MRPEAKVRQKARFISIYTWALFGWIRALLIVPYGAKFKKRKVSHFWRFEQSD